MEAEEAKDAPQQPMVGRTEKTMVWTPEELELLRLCRNRAYHKVNTKRRQHLPASLSSFTLREWQIGHPKDKFSAKYIIGIYTQNFEQADRNRRRALSKRRRTGAAQSEMVEDSVVPEDEDALEDQLDERVVISMDDHSDKQWTQEMLDSLMRCGDRVTARQTESSDAEKSKDMSSLLLEEWLALFPKSTLSGRNLKSRLTVYQKTRSEAPPPSKRRKFEETLSRPKRGSSSSAGTGRRAAAATIGDEAVRSAWRSAREKGSSSSSEETKFWDLVREELAAKHPGKQIPSLESLKTICSSEEEEASSLDASQEEDGLDEVQDEFAPDESKDFEDDYNDTWACGKHWMHMFHDADKDIECVLTDQLLQIRDNLKAAFPGCDVYSPKKPKGFSVRALKEWQLFYPKSEENIKSISVKFYKYDRRPEEDGNEVVRNDKGRVLWTPTVLANLKKSRKIAMQKAGDHPTSHMVTRKWKEEWKKMYPDLDCDWKVVVSRYNYHYGGLDSLSEGSNGASAAAAAAENAAFEADDKVKGFRNWTAKTRQDLLDTHRKILGERPEIEPGCSEFNKLLLLEFQKLNPKCMESSRSIYSKVQSIEKEEQQNRNSSSSSSLAAAATQQQLSRNSSRTSHDEPAPEAEVKDEKQDNESSNGESNAPIVPKEEEEEVSKANNTPGETNGSENVAEKKENANEEEADSSVKDEPMETDQLIEAPLETKAEDEKVKSEEVGPPESPIEGFDDWTLAMIRDFIGCMDRTRKRFATLKKEDNDGSVKLVPLLLEEWQSMYPTTEETVKTFLVKIKHLKHQKDLIKRHLSFAGLLPKCEPNSSNEIHTESFETSKPVVGPSPGTSSGGGGGGGGRRSQANSRQGKPSEAAIASLGEFKWHKTMINDVIDSRRRALEVKDQSMAKGKKLSFHTLWAEEFRAIYPNSTFTSNNLSVHLWTWRKQQQKLGLADPMYDESQKLADTSRPQPAHPSTWTPQWNSKLRAELLVLGKRVQANLSNPNTPNELKVQGFSNLLHEEWAKLHPRRSDTVRGLNMMYSRILKDGVDGSAGASSSLPKFNWTPKHNKALRQCMAKLDAQAPVSYAVYTSRVIDEWRRVFPGAVDETDEGLTQRICDLTKNQENSNLGLNSPNFHSKQPLAEQLPNNNLVRLQSRASSRSESFDSVPEFDHGPANIVRAPNARGQMCWNKQTIRDLFNCHQVGLAQRQASLAAMSKKEAPILSTLVHSEFLKLHPYCKLTPAILMAKLYCWKNAKNKGTLDLEITSEEEEKARMLAIKQSEKAEAEASASGLSITPVGGEPSKQQQGRDIVFRTWSQEMIENLVKTRKTATIKKQRMLEEGGRVDVQLVDVWYEEFIRLHPDYKSTKKNLMQKYKWYRSRVKKLGGSVDGERKKSSKSDPPLVVSEVKAAPEKEHPAVAAIRAKNIRKDVFLHIKALMEESRIFLPMKLPQEPELKQEFLTLAANGTNGGAGQFAINPSGALSIIPRMAHQVATTTSSQGPVVLGQPPSFIMSQQEAAKHSASQALAQMHHKALQDQQVSLTPTTDLRVTPSPNLVKPDLPLNLSLPAHIKQQPHQGAASEASADKKDTIKLPGGATLVAVTDRNADALLKPKPVEKPHVTITIGEKVKLPGNGATASLTDEVNISPVVSTTPSPSVKQPIVLSIPKVPVRNGGIFTAPPLPQLKPMGFENPLNGGNMKPPQIAILPLQGGSNGGAGSPGQALRLLPNFSFTPKAIFIPSRVKARLDEHGMTEVQFINLLNIYAKARNEYIETLKRGYLAFFPYILGSLWRQQSSNITNNLVLAGRKLAGIVDLYVEEKNKGKVVTPEYLTKKPCQFEISEQLLKQILIMRAETMRDFEEAGEEQPNTAMANSETCKRWALAFPEMKMTTKQLISIHEMLTYDTSKPSASPEIECNLTDVWRIMEKSLNRMRSEESAVVKREAEEEPLYDKDNISYETVQEWLLETQGIEGPKEIKRPRFFVKNKRFYWSNERMESLEAARQVALTRRKSFKRKYLCPSLADLIYAEFKKRHPEKDVSKTQVMAKCLRNVRREKRRKYRREERLIKRWKRECEEFLKSEDLNQVIEAQEELDAEEEMEDDSDPVFSGKLTSLSKISSLNIASNNARNFNNDQDVLDYIGEVQRLGKGASHPITWTPDVIRDLMRARHNARKRKREWEAWATREYGGVGFAYNNPNVKTVKVDDMFKEEWAKLRPDMASLSIWTLVSYARKYDNLKKQLILDNNQTDLKPDAEAEDVTAAAAERRVIQTTVFFEDSGVPKFDLEELEKLEFVPQEFRDLLKTRQLAKTRQTEEGGKSLLTLPALWEEEWRKLHPKDKSSGLVLRNRLWALERNPENITMVKPVLLRVAATEKARPCFQEDERPQIVPRDNVFVEDDEDVAFETHCSVDVRTEKKRTERWLVRFTRDVFNRKRLGCSVPALEKEEEERHWDEEEEEVVLEEMQIGEGRRFPPPSKFRGVRTAVAKSASVFVEAKGKFRCAECGLEFSNVNNLEYHRSVHGGPSEEDFWGYFRHGERVGIKKSVVQVKQ